MRRPHHQRATTTNWGVFVIKCVVFLFLVLHQIVDKESRAIRNICQEQVQWKKIESTEMHIQRIGASI